MLIIHRSSFIIHRFRIVHYKVVIIGAGPSGLLLARMLKNRGIDCVILENRNESYLRQLSRGGILERGVVELLQQEKASHQILEKGILISKFDFHIEGRRIAVQVSESPPTPKGENSLRKDKTAVYSPLGVGGEDNKELRSSKQAIIYSQQNIVADLLDGLKADGQPIIFEAKGQRYEGLDTDKVKIIYTLDGQIHSMTCDYVVGCDGYRGISRRTIPKSRRQEVVKELPYAWLEWLSSNPSSTENLVIAFSKNGFAMQVPETNGQTRFYLQVQRGIEIDDLPTEESIWDDFENRIGQSVHRVKMENRKLDYMRLYYSQTMQHGRLFIAGDAAHIVPRFGSKGLNLAFIDAAKLAEGFSNFYINGDNSFLENYSQRCLSDNLKTIQYTNQLNHLFHINEATSFEVQVEKIQQLLTNEKRKIELIKYLIG